LTDIPEYVVVGRFGRPRGVSGELYLDILTDNPERFDGQTPLWIEGKNSWVEIKLIDIRPMSGRASVTVEGIGNNDEAGLLTNKLLYVRKSDLGPAPEGKYYYFDLVGCRVEDETHHYYGTVAEVEDFPANEVLLIVDENGKEYLFPMVKHFIREINIAKKLIVIIPPKGIFENAHEN